MKEPELAIKDLPLWQYFSEIANDEQKVMVKKSALEAEFLLDRIIETFPTYTLHNHVHVCNVVRLMGELLGNDIQKLSSLEAAFLILSAYFHDLGMVYNEEERENIKEEPEFEKFLQEYPQAFLEVKKSVELPQNIAEWYCRWAHAKRIYQALDRLNEKDFNWGVTPLKKYLCYVCESHNWDSMDLINNKKLPSDFRSNEADLLFCGTLLRLADILDFDRSRSPEPIYKYLGLEKRDNKRKEISDVEWLKHLCSEGFKFPDTTERDKKTPYQIGFIASPTNPAVENDLREFLDEIKNELRSCAIVTKRGSEKWREFALPYMVDRKDIISQGYIFGKHFFTLEKEQVLNLFMGENLYDEPTVFIRELLQNAIDTSRHREHYEHTKGNPDFKAKPIEVRTWLDNDNCRWIEVKDYGMGMDQNIIENYFLKVGKSYYLSPEFEAEKLRYMEKTKIEFGPISRFGIGILSCFIIGDKVEISTFRLNEKSTAEEPAPIRLSLSGIHGFYIMQKGKNMTPSPMPGPKGNEDGYRKKFGTTVAVRIDPKKETGFHLKEVLVDYILCPPIPIIFEGERIGLEPEVAIDKPWLDKTIIRKFSEEDVKKIEEVLHIKFLNELKIIIAPINLTIHSKNPYYLKGQLLAIQVAGSFKNIPEKKQENYRSFIDYEFLLKNNEIPFFRVSFEKIHRRIPNLTKDKMSHSVEMEDLKEILPLKLMNIKKWLTHNGISVPLNLLKEKLKFSYNPRSFNKINWMHGIIALYDNFRPELSLARDQLREIPWNILCTIQLAYIEALKTSGIKIDEYFSYEIFRINYPKDINFIDLKIKDSNWFQQPILGTEEGNMSIEEVKQFVSKNGEIKVGNVPKTNIFFNSEKPLSIINLISPILIQMELNFKLKIDVPICYLLVDNINRPELKEGLMFFPPLFFAPYINYCNLLRFDNFPLNQNHPFSIWLIDNANKLQEHFPGLFQIIKKEISRKVSYCSDIITQVNNALDCIKKGNKYISVPSKIWLKEDDFNKEDGSFPFSSIGQQDT